MEVKGKTSGGEGGSGEGKPRRRCSDCGSGQRPNSHVYLYLEDAMPAACGHFRVGRGRERDAGRADERQGGKRTVSCVTRHGTVSNEFGNLIPTDSTGDSAA